jgi:carboxyl-terminal processing protease
MLKRFVVIISILALISTYAIEIRSADTLTPATDSTTDKSKEPYSRDDVYRQIELYSTALSNVLGNYYENLTKEQIEKIMGESIKGMLQGLGDRYSYYQEETRRRREQENLFFAKFGGIGIRILPSPDGFVYVVQPMDGSPAMKSGLHSGDKIFAVDGKSIENQLLEDVVNTIRGEVGTKVTLTILRPGVDATFDVVVTREIINYPSIKNSLINDNIGYIAISDFTAETATELNKSIEELMGKGMKGLILDLRGNSGGLLTSAIDVSNTFIPEGLIVSTDGRLDRYDSEYRAVKEKMTYPANMPMVLLVNNGSASSSEIVAGAIKDYKRGLLIGERTFGKGVVQQRFPLDEDRAVSITVSIYKTPNGNWIHEKNLFSVDVNMQKELDEGKISDNLRKEFVNNKITLTDTATIKTKDKIRDKGIAWQINDGESIYTIRKEEGKLKVSQGGVNADIEVEQPNLLEEDSKDANSSDTVKTLTKFYDYLEKHKEQLPEEQLKSLMEKMPELMKTLSDNGITLNERIVRMYVKRTYASTQSAPNIDLENDLQLARAVEEINKQIK